MSNAAPATLSRRAAALAKRQAAEAAAAAQGLPAPRQGDNLRSAPLVPCPYCERELHQGAPYASHLRACIANPDLFAAVRAKLDDGKGGIVRQGAYNLIRGDLPSAGGLRSQMQPDSWPSVAIRFGLAPIVGKLMALDHAVDAAGVEMDATMAADAAEAAEAQAARLPSGLVVARVTVTERVVWGGAGWGVRVREERYELR